MKKIIICFLLLFVNNVANSQTNFGREWLIGGVGYYLNFQNIPPIHDSIYLTNTTNTGFGAGKSCISDSNGHTILISDGMNIYNRQGEIIENGDSLASPDYYSFEQGWNHYAQTSIFLPMQDGKYYFVMPTCNDTNLNNVWLGSTGKAPYNQLLYCVIDMKANAGTGKVVTRNIPLMEN